MNRYRNLGGDSNVVAYDYDDDQIDVRFQDGATYRYTVASAGRVNIDHMKILADRGQGLNSFINLHVRSQYASKRR